jgi:hypothetical protein
MAKANPKAYFPGYIAQISYRKVDRTAQAWRAHRPYFDTWKEAHDFMLERARARLKKSQAEIASAKRHLGKVEAMKEPAT